MLKRKTESLEDLINQGLIANQKIPLPKKSNENVTGSYLEYPEENIEYGSNINYPNPYNEGEFFTPDNVSLGQQNIRKNIPLGLGMAQTPIPRSMPMNMLSMEEPQQDDSTNFLGSLVSQGAAMLGAGVRGGDVGQVGRMFDLDRQEAFRQGQYQKQKAEQKQKIKEQENTAKQYVDPNSEISIQERAKAEELYPFQIPKNLSYADINNKNVIQALQAKYNATQEQKSLEEQKGLQSRLDDPNSEESKNLMESLIKLKINVPKGLSANQMKQYYGRLVELSKPQPMIGGGGVRGGGVRQEKPEKEVKSNQKLLDDYTEHAQSLRSSIDVMDAVNKLNRTRIGKYTPDFSTNTQAQSGTVDRAGADLVKVLAGAGTVSDSDFARLKDLVPNSNMTKDLAKETAKNQTLEGTNKSLARLRLDRDLGRINETDFKKIINQYNRYLKDPKLELNKQINIDTGEIEDISSPNKVKFSEEQ
jgi:hypothetical protein